MSPRRFGPQLSPSPVALALALSGALACPRDAGPARSTSGETDTVPAAAPAIALESRERDRRHVAPAVLRKAGGDAQTGHALAMLRSPLSLHVRDASGRPAAGVPVKWAVPSGGGQVRPTSSVTDNRGFARARWRLGPSIGAQVVTAVVAELPAVRFRASVPVASVSVSPERLTIWAGDIVQLRAIPRDSAGGALTGGAVRWVAADVDVATVTTGSGMLVGLGPGSTSVVARVGGERGVMRVTVLPVVRGQLFSPTGGELAGLRLQVRTRAGVFSTAVAPSGRFALRIPTPLRHTAEVFIDAAIPTRREYHPSMLRLPADQLRHEVRAVLVPTRWMITAGRYAGRVEDIRIAEALERTRDGTRFVRLTTEAARSPARVVAWPASAFPIAVAFRRTSGNLPISRADSTAFWDVLRQLEEDLGTVLFRPARHESTLDSHEGIVVAVNPSIGSEGLTFISWTANGNVYDGTVSVRLPRLLGESAIVTHEMLHALGFGHTRGWSSVLSSGARTPYRATPADVAHAQLVYRVRHAQATWNAPYGIVEAARAAQHRTDVLATTSDRREPWTTSDRREP